MVDDPDDARNMAGVELGARALIGQIDLPGHRHPAVCDFDVQPVAWDREIPMQSFHDANPNVKILSQFESGVHILLGISHNHHTFGMVGE